LVASEKLIKLNKNDNMRKDKVLETVNDLPSEFELEELIERLIFIEKVEKGLQQIDKGETRTHDEVKQIVKSWRK
jgi:predicted transcriptional regulator